MNRIFAAVGLTAALALTAGAAAAKPHPEWHAGAHIANEDWNRGQHFDYRAHHFNEPPAGYEWREVDGNYVLAAVATGVIASVILAQ